MLRAEPAATSVPNSLNFRGFQGLKNMLLLVVVFFFFFHMANRELKRPADPCLSSLVAQAAGQTCTQISAQMPEQDGKK